MRTWIWKVYEKDIHILGNDDAIDQDVLQIKNNNKNPDELAEEIIKNHPDWKDDFKMLLIRGLTTRYYNSYIYNIGLWR